MNNNIPAGAALLAGLGVGFFGGAAFQHHKQMKKVKEVQPLINNILSGMDEAITNGADADEYLERLWMELRFINQVVK